MHYQDGTPAQLGDLCRTTLKEGAAGSETIGILVGGTSTSTSCNGQLQPLARVCVMMPPQR